MTAFELPQLPPGWKYGIQRTEDNRNGIGWEIKVADPDGFEKGNVVCNYIYEQYIRGTLREELTRVCKELAQRAEAFVKYGYFLMEDEVVIREFYDAVDKHNNTDKYEAVTKKFDKLVGLKDALVYDGEQFLINGDGVKIILADEDDIRPATKDFPIG